tara:strand:- start:379 stop:2223 length:1845 start_codon:yes stop_codon:yes gene_type:complete
MAGKKIIKILKGLGRSRRDVYREVSPEVRDYLIKNDIAVDATKKQVPVIDLQKVGPTGTRKVNTLSNTAARRMVKNIQADKPPISAKLLTTPKTTEGIRKKLDDLENRRSSSDITYNEFMKNEEEIIRLRKKLEIITDVPPQPTTAEQFTIKSRENFEKDKANEVIRLQKQRDNIGKKLSKLAQGDNTVAFNKGVAELKLINEKLNRVVNTTSKSRLDAEKQIPLADRKEMEKLEKGSLIDVGKRGSTLVAKRKIWPRTETELVEDFKNETIIGPRVYLKELDNEGQNFARQINKQLKILRKDYVESKKAGVNTDAIIAEGKRLNKQLQDLRYETGMGVVSGKGRAIVDEEPIRYDLSLNPYVDVDSLNFIEDLSYKGTGRSVTDTGKLVPELKSDTQTGFSRTPLSPLVGTRPRELSKDTRKIASIVEKANEQFKVSSIKDKKRVAKLVEDYLNKGGSITKLEDGVARAASTGPEPSLVELQALLGVDVPRKGAGIGKTGQGVGKISMYPHHIRGQGKRKGKIPTSSDDIDIDTFKEEMNLDVTSLPRVLSKEEIKKVSETEARRLKKLNEERFGKNFKIKKKGGRIKKQKRNITAPRKRVALRGQGAALRGF